MWMNMSTWTQQFLSSIWSVFYLHEQKKLISFEHKQLTSECNKKEANFCDKHQVGNNDSVILNFHNTYVHKYFVLRLQGRTQKDRLVQEDCIDSTTRWKPTKK